LADLNRQYLTAATTGSSIAGTFKLFPQSSHARLFSATFDNSDRVDAFYVIVTSGRERCLLVRATGPVPNRVDFKQTDGDCRRWRRSSCR